MIDVYILGGAGTQPPLSGCAVVNDWLGLLLAVTRVADVHCDQQIGISC